MGRSRSVRTLLQSSLVLSLSLLTGSPADRPRAALEVGTKARLAPAFGRLPLYFIENRGQADPRVAYYVQGRGSSLYFTAEGVTFALTKRQVGTIRPVSLLLGRPLERDSDGSPERWAVNLDFVEARPGARPEGREQTAAVVSYFKGPRAQWQTGLPTYASLQYRELWPGIDVTYAGREGRLKSSFVVRPGADPGQIRLAYRGATAVGLNAAGELEVTTPVGGFREERPYVYQEVGGRRVNVDVSYVLGPAAEGEHAYGFRVGPYDRTRPLVLDPAVLVYAGYIGGSGSDGASGIAVDGAGNAYVAGSTTSTEATFPVTVGPALTFNGVEDAFVAKVNAAGTALVYVGYIGGSGSDGASGIAVDGAGNAYVAGSTTSTEATFPVTGGPALTFNGGRDAFVAKVNASGTALVYCGYIGGSGNEGEFSGIAVDGAGNAYVAGRTTSTEATFPVTVGPDLTYNGALDAFVAKVNAAGTALVYAGYIGGSRDDGATGIAVDGSGNAYVAGSTLSSEATFPVTVGPDLTYNGGFPDPPGGDAFVAKVNAAGTALVYAGYIGGSVTDGAIGIAVDDSGNAYVAGDTGPTGGFPVTGGPDLTFNGFFDAFVAKVNAAGTALVYAGYIGGSGVDLAFGIAIDVAGQAYITGWTTSTEATFPVTEGPDLTYNGGGSDTFVAKVNAAGTALAYAGYIGGSGDDQASAIAVDGTGAAYVAGVTTSPEATFPVAVGPDLTFNGGGDAFVAKIGVMPCGNGILDPGEQCDPAIPGESGCCSGTCEFQPSTMLCRPSAGVCDVPDFCTGSSATCPADAKSTAVCRPAAGQCDVAESCDGLTDDCPPDGLRPDGIACDDGNTCTSPDTCRSGVCSGTVLRDGSSCDDGNSCTRRDKCRAGVCTGKPLRDGTVCDDGNACTSADACLSGACTGTCEIGTVCGSGCFGQLHCAQDGSACVCR